MMDDPMVSAQASLDQMAEWYKLFAPFFADIQQTLIKAGVNPATTSVIIAQQHARLITPENEE